VVDAYRGVLEMKGDAERGKQVFTKTCAACHKVQNVGNDIGPNLAAMKARGPESILLNVLDPNREVNPQYLNYAVLTADGRQLTGLIAAETATSMSATCTATSTHQITSCRATGGHTSTSHGRITMASMSHDMT